MTFPTTIFEEFSTAHGSTTSTWDYENKDVRLQDDRNLNFLGNVLYSLTPINLTNFYVVDSRFSIAWVTYHWKGPALYPMYECLAVKLGIHEKE